MALGWNSVRARRRQASVDFMHSKVRVGHRENIHMFTPRSTTSRAVCGCALTAGRCGRVTAIRTMKTNIISESPSTRCDAAYMLSEAQYMHRKEVRKLFGRSNCCTETECMLFGHAPNQLSILDDQHHRLGDDLYIELPLLCKAGTVDSAVSFIYLPRECAFFISVEAVISWFRGLLCNMSLIEGQSLAVACKGMYKR
jgi:hypothetical protein